MILDLHLWNYSAAYTNDIPLLILSFLSQHFILFAACSCPSQASQIRSTNSQFHGSVRHEMEHRKLQEKKMEVKEKLDKYEERKLSIFCSELVMLTRIESSDDELCGAIGEILREGDIPTIENLDIHSPRGRSRKIVPMENSHQHDQPMHRKVLYDLESRAELAYTQG
ncbi:hypothetical protein FXO38_32039 [Capsicum annuum]|nr:hypothetical protein FXO38_32039 [Capsicum annuum]KAF3664141.1 hypothetical protein FXO37_11626 [Capsicum annuum]